MKPVYREPAAIDADIEQVRSEIRKLRERELALTAEWMISEKERIRKEILADIEAGKA